jgi:choline-sulfatase
MQALAERGVVYENAYCPSPLCMPSRSAFLSGLWAHQIQTYSNCNVCLEDARYPTLGRVLDEQGVHTAFVGKTDVYRPADELGFSEMIKPQDRAWPGDTNHRRRPLGIRHGAARRAAMYGPHPNPFARDRGYIDAAVDWLLNRAPSIDRPWVLCVNINSPHFPQWVTQELWDMYAGADDLPLHGGTCASANHPYARDLRDHFETDQFPEEHIRGLRRGYLGCITYVDRELGRLVHGLQQAGMYDDTNVIYTSDHGDMMGKFGMWWKCSLYDDSVRVPLIAAGPDFAAGRVRTPVSSMDMQASLFACVDRERPAHWQSGPLQQVAEKDASRAVFAEYHGHGARSGSWMIRKGDWKLIHYAEAPDQLFDLAEDPEELANLAGTRPNKLAELHTELDRVCDVKRENERAHAFEERQWQVLVDAGLAES